MPEHQQVQQSKKTNTIFQKHATPVIQTPVSNPYSIIQRARINPKSLTQADVMQLQRTIGNRAVAQLLSGVVNSSTAQQATVQRQEIPEEEEPLQGKMTETVQRQEIPEEEEPLQGKMIETIQRQEIPEDEEPLQGKFEDKPEIACPSCFAATLVQRQEIPEEKEPLQGKMIETIQRQEIPEEEEPLQGKFKEPIQRQEIPEEEEPLQGKMIETVQRQEIPEEEPLQGNMIDTVQRQEIPEEEKPLQGKMIGIIQRQEIPEEEEPLQGKFESIQRQGIPEEEPLQTKRENNTGMPDNLKAGVENLSGIDMSDVRVHYNSGKPAEIGALAYTQGTNIHVAPGQERHLPHEAWHVVQQAQGRVKPTMQMKGGVPVNNDEGLEHEADVMGEKAFVNTAPSRDKPEELRMLQNTSVPAQRTDSKQGKFHETPSASIQSDSANVSDRSAPPLEFNLAGVVIQREIGQSAPEGSYVKRVDGNLFQIVKATYSESVWSYQIQEASGKGDKLSVGQNDKNYSRAPREFTKLRQYDRINVIDPGSPGTGHQAGVIKLLESIANVGYVGEVFLSYNTIKTSIYANKFGKSEDLKKPETSYGLYHFEWDSVFPENAKVPHQLKIHCHPLGELDIHMTHAEESVFATLENLWKNYAWPGANPPDFTDPVPSSLIHPIWDAKKKWSKSNPKLSDCQKQFRSHIDETRSSVIDLDKLPNLPAKDPGVKTLTAFGAMDIPDKEAADQNLKSTYFERYWLPTLKRMTGVEDPVSIILQPFLWSRGHPMQVRGGGSEIVDISSKIGGGGGTAAYGWKPPNMADDDAVIEKQPEIAKEVLRKAKNKIIHLVTAYYGDSVSDIKYPQLLKVIVEVFKQVQDEKQVIIALLGNDKKEAHIETARDIKSNDIGALTEAPLKNLKIQLAHFGRTEAMAQFQRYSDLFITEGANTWQEVLTLGTPALSVRPGGDTKPWDVGPLNGFELAREKIKSASDALIKAGENPSGSKDKIKIIADFVMDLRSDTSIVRRYFHEWSVMLSKSESDQVVTALQNLPEVR